MPVHARRAALTCPMGALLVLAMTGCRAVPRTVQVLPPTHAQGLFGAPEVAPGQPPLITDDVSGRRDTSHDDIASPAAPIGGTEHAKTAFDLIAVTYQAMKAGDRTGAQQSLRTARTLLAGLSAVDLPADQRKTLDELRQGVDAVIQALESPSQGETSQSGVKVVQTSAKADGNLDDVLQHYNNAEKAYKEGNYDRALAEMQQAKTRFAAIDLSSLNPEAQKAATKVSQSMDEIIRSLQAVTAADKSKP